jgi:hypothetical protein
MLEVPMMIYLIGWSHPEVTATKFPYQGSSNWFIQLSSV